MEEEIYTGWLPILALRGLTVFPGQTVHFEVGRKKSVEALEQAMKRDKKLFLVSQLDVTCDDPGLADLYSMGCVAEILQVLKSHNENARVLVKGINRAQIMHLQQTTPCLGGIVEAVESGKETNSIYTAALRREANAAYNRYLELTDHPAQTLQLQMFASDRCGFIADCIGQNSSLELEIKMKLLRQLNPTKRLEQAIAALNDEMQVLEIENELQEKTRAAMDQEQRDYFLREQMKVISEELGEPDEFEETAEYEKKILQLHLDEESEMKLRKDVQRLKKQPFGSAEASVLRNYLDTVLELPWNKYSKERVDVKSAEKILNKEHYGLEKVKQRVLETISVRKLAPEMPPQILCLVGPPGVGKTSIAYSVAHCLNRKMARIALGGVHDEADIRGHRKTYIGAMPGRILAAMTQAGTMNPVLLLDEIDKMASDYRGDPSSALLEVLDGEQNKTYRDHYIELPFDLSHVMFITTANSLDTVPRPLLDRMEIIEINSYTDEEKMMIAKNHLLPKQLQKHGLKKSLLQIRDSAIREIITCYTRESGVRNLERSIADICRKSAKLLIDGEQKITVNGGDLEQFLGVRKYLPDRLPESDQIGLVTGLAWTSVGGETLEVEVNVMDGTGKLELTGNLGDVMKESAQAALSYIRAHASELGIEADFYKTKDIHVHFPEGAVPKDGPSAGVTVCTAIVSALTMTPVRRDIAMTGEISIRGRVMQIGGLKEKTMAALRHGIHTVIIPEDNLRDLEEIDQTVRRSLCFVTASHVETVLKNALVKSAELPCKDLPRRIPEHSKSRAAEIRQ